MRWRCLQSEHIGADACCGCPPPSPHINSMDALPLKTQQRVRDTLRSFLFLWQGEREGIIAVQHEATQVADSLDQYFSLLMVSDGVPCRLMAKLNTQ